MDVAVAKGRRHKGMGESGMGWICGSGADENATDTRDGGTNPVSTAVCEGMYINRTEACR